MAGRCCASPASCCTTALGDHAETPRYIETIPRRGDVALARQYYRGAIEVEPGFARAWAGLAGTYWLDTVEGRTPPAEVLPLMRDAAERALELDPGDPLAPGMLASHELQEGRFDDAETELRKVRELNPLPQHVNEVLGRVLVLQGRFDEAVDLAKPWPEGPSRNMIQAMAWHGLGRGGESEAALRALSESPRGMDRLRIAEVHAFRGEADETFRWLLGSVEDEPGGLQAVSPSALGWMIPLSPFLRPLHSAPRWAAWQEARGRERGSRAVASNR